jgi:hypothetical protein
MKHIFSVFLLVFAFNLAQGQKQVNKNQAKESAFKIIKTKGLPDYYAVTGILKKSGLSEICQKKEIDQLEIDLMFLKTAANPFDTFVTIKVKNGSDKMFNEIFSEKKLFVFWNLAREYLEKQQH